MAAQIKARMDALRTELDEAKEKAAELNEKVKVLQQENLAKEQEIRSLSHRNQLLEEEIGKMGGSLKEAKDAAKVNAQNDTQNEALQRRLQLLEEEAEEADKTMRETVDKLRQTDVKAGHYERKVQALEASRDQWETKYEEMAKKHTKLQDELRDLEVSIGNI